MDLLRLAVLVSFLSTSYVWVGHSDAKPLFLCDDGTTVLLTDNENKGCPTYSPQADLIVVPDGSTWSDVQWAVATARPESFQPRTRISAAGDEYTDVCREWGDLNLRTDGGLDMGSTETTRRWLALSRIVTSTNLCERYLRADLYPGF